MTVLKKRADTNVNEAERIVGLIGGAGLIGYGLMRRDKTGALLAALGGTLAYRGASGHCPLYQTLGINMASSRSGVPYELGVRVDAEVMIRRRPEELYRFWRKLSNLPRFMRHVESVHEKNGRLSHWVVTGPAGSRVEWDSEIVNDVEPEVIGWRSLPGSQVDNGGSVRFERAGEDHTRVRVSLQYNPPAGTLGAMIARAFGEDPRTTVQEDLERFKELMESGRLTSTPSRETEDRWRRGSRKEDLVQSSSEESFPASDAPSWTPETL